MGDWIIVQRDDLSDAALVALELGLSDVLASMGGRLTFDEVIGDHLDGKSDIMVTCDDDGSLRSIVVMRVLNFPSGLRVLDIQLGTGHLDDFCTKLEALGEARAIQSGCHKIQIEGRPGWIRALGDGWQEYQRKIEKEI